MHVTDLALSPCIPPGVVPERCQVEPKSIPKQKKPLPLPCFRETRDLSTAQTDPSSNEEEDRDGKESSDTSSFRL